MTPILPYGIREAFIQVSGRAFWFKDPYRDFLLAAGVPADTYDRYAEESKFKIARHVLAELDQMGEDGATIQRRIITELCKLRDIPDKEVPDRDAGLEALRRLKILAIENKLYVERVKADEAQRRRERAQQQAAVEERRRKLSELRNRFNGMVTSQDPQERGYEFQDLLVELFNVHEINCRPPYRTNTEEIDGHFKYGGFDYLLEARWRQHPPTEADLAAFKAKVDKKLASTRGLFVSVIGFREPVVQELTRCATSNIVLMDGQDLSLILEGQISLTGALDLKIKKAAQEGKVFFPLADRFSD